MFGPAYPMSHVGPTYVRKGDPWHPKALHPVASGRRRSSRAELRGAAGRRWHVTGNLNSRGPVTCVLTPRRRRAEAAPPAADGDAL